MGDKEDERERERETGRMTWLERGGWDAIDLG